MVLGGCRSFLLLVTTHKIDPQTKRERLRDKELLFD